MTYDIYYCFMQEADIYIMHVYSCCMLILERNNSWIQFDRHELINNLVSIYIAGVFQCHIFILWDWSWSVNKKKHKKISHYRNAQEEWESKWTCSYWQHHLIYNENINLIYFEWL